MNEARRRAILEMAARDPELVAQLPAVVAAGFGVLALRRLGDILTVACFPGANRQALRLLREVLELEIVATPFEFSLLYEAIRSAYFPGDEAVNFPTFRDPDFLDDPATIAALREEKVERMDPVVVDMPESHVAFCCMTYRSELRNQDAPRLGGGLPDPGRTRLELGDLHDGWRVVDGTVQVFGSAPAPDAKLLATEYRLSEHLHMRGGGRISEHDVQTRSVTELPMVIHPTEVQVIGIEADGALRFHVYDRVVRVPTGEPARIDLAYHFLNYGNRMYRSIELEIHEVVCVPRDKLVVHAEPIHWGARELARWFGLDYVGEG